MELVLNYNTLTNKPTFSNYDWDDKGDLRKMALDKRSAFLKQNNTVRISKDVFGV